MLSQVVQKNPSARQAAANFSACALADTFGAVVVTVLPSVGSGSELVPVVEYSSITFENRESLRFCPGEAPIPNELGTDGGDNPREDCRHYC